MKTISRTISEELFNEIRRIELSVMHLGGYIQNPDCVNESNARINFINFDTDYKLIINRLEVLRENVFNLHDDIIV